MKYDRYHRLFWAILIATFVVGTGFDLVAVKETHQSDETNYWVNYSYEILGVIDKIELSLRDNLEARVAKDPQKERISLEDITKDILSLREKKFESESQIRSLKKFDFLNAVPTDEGLKLVEQRFTQLAEAIESIKNEERSLLIKRMQNDQQVTQSLNNKVLLTSLLDFALLAAAGVLWIAFDRKRRADESLLKTAVELSNKSNEELKKLIDERSKKLRMTIHDLKNPLGSIKGFSDLIEEEKDNPETVAEMSNTIQRISNHTLEMVNALIEAEKRNLQTSPDLVDVVKCIEEICSILKPRIRSKNQTLISTHTHPHFFTIDDSKSLMNALMNLIENAVKFSPQGAFVHVNSQVSDKGIQIEIEDQGPGFSESDKQNAFKEFQQLSAKPTGGEISSGLGLRIAKDIIEEHHGSILIENGTLGIGTKIVIQLPQYKEPKPHLNLRNPTEHLTI